MTFANQLTIRDEIRLAEKRKAKSVWYNRSKQPERDPNSGLLVRPHTIYVDETASPNPVWTDPALDFNKFQEGYHAYKEGKTNDKGKFIEDPYIGEWRNIAQEYHSKYYEAATITNSEFLAIDVINVMTRMLGTELRNFILPSAVTVVSTPQLELNVDTFTRFTASRDVGEGVEAPTKRGSVSRASFDLLKDVGHIAITDEAQMKAVHDLYRVHIENAQSDLTRIKALKIAAEMTTATPTGVGGSDWALFAAGGNSTTNPYDDIGKATDAIYANNGNANTFALHDQAWRDLVGNTHVKGIMNISNPGMPLSVAKSGVLPGANLQYYVDNSLITTEVIVFEKDAIWLMQGPVNARQYRLENTGVDAYITRDWNLCKIVQSSRIRKVTGISAP